MKHEDVIYLVRGWLMLDVDRRDVLQAKGRPMSTSLLLQTLDRNCPQWRNIDGLEEEIHDLIFEASDLHRMKL